MNTKGFTLIELLVTIAIIGVLASVILGSINTAREKSMTTKAKAELRNARTAIAFLENDTGKWPNGCTISQVITGSDNEIELTNTCSGLADSAPPDSGCTCQWEDSEIAKWDGPYFPNTTDPWGKAYQFDSDYYPRQDCSTKDPDNPDNVAVAVIFSSGPDGQGNGTGGDYDCDDIYRILR